MKVLTTLAIVLSCALPAAAQTSAAGPPLRLEFPLFDAPYNFANGGRAPSMPQSLAVSELFYEGSHRAIERMWGGRRRAARWSVLAWDFFNVLVLPLPGGDAWLHEEYHRAVMGNRGVDSFNDVYNFALTPDVIAVSHVADEDLVRLKRQHPVDQVRMGPAGIEGEYQLVQALEKNQFFDRSTAWHFPIYLITKIGSAAYVMSGTWDRANEETDNYTAQDGPNVEARDFTGHDFLGWVYDLHRPDEPYTGRGPHPSGVGIDRYIKPDDLTAEEFRYLKREGRLQLLNFIDPFLVGFESFTARNPFSGRPFRWNASAGHMLTSFGRTIDANLFLEQDRAKLFVVFHLYSNGARTFPGLDVQAIDCPVTIFGRSVQLSPRGAIWIQPSGQRFRTERGSIGGLIGAKLHRTLDGRYGGYLEVEAKTAGWVAGNVFLGRKVSLRAGASIAVP